MKPSTLPAGTSPWRPPMVAILRLPRSATSGRHGCCGVRLAAVPGAKMRWHSHRPLVKCFADEVRLSRLPCLIVNFQSLRCQIVDFQSLKWTWRGAAENGTGASVHPKGTWSCRAPKAAGPLPTTKLTGRSSCCCCPRRIDQSDRARLRNSEHSAARVSTAVAVAPVAPIWRWRRTTQYAGPYAAMVAVTIGI